MSDSKICFIGAGNMTRSIVSGLIANGHDPKAIITTNPSRPKLEALAQDFGVNISSDNLASATASDVIVLSVKPQIMAQVCAELAAIDLSNKLVITIAAGITSARYQDYFQQPLALVRAMPNTPSQLGLGMTGLFATSSVNEQQAALCQALLSSIGKIMWVNKEDDLNLVIALAGSSPAYFFLFIEAMIESATQLGMDAEQARVLAQQAALGSAAMLENNPEISVSQLRQNVTSKGGTTHEAIVTFEQGGLRRLVDDAMNNAIKRAQEMAQTF
ncbi:pyrroline-5-carboxylate reductase [Shewanella sp. NIFS-20-20]|uniref:pyrroline-5-carboxylate reductase n=1 Tax=Shewanella sp. NIFS-20-20 TaxID=2853806 RepID=UPI001C452D13|nr:pyrroline-5-carboxylate reductase [Shewanella sp. NIFS-20-20]MBV7316621.1 pyrroline-5-carboxylate reductase [Shewanella sp. NIFS-20-20]